MLLHHVTCQRRQAAAQRNAPSPRGCVFVLAPLSCRLLAIHTGSSFPPRPQGTTGKISDLGYRQHLTSTTVARDVRSIGSHSDSTPASSRCAHHRTLLSAIPVKGIFIFQLLPDATGTCPLCADGLVADYLHDISCPRWEVYIPHRRVQITEPVGGLLRVAHQSGQWRFQVGHLKRRPLVRT